MKTNNAIIALLGVIILLSCVGIWLDHENMVIFHAKEHQFLDDQSEHVCSMYESIKQNERFIFHPHDFHDSELRHLDFRGKNVYTDEGRMVIVTTENSLQSAEKQVPTFRVFLVKEDGSALEATPDNKLLVWNGQKWEEITDPKRSAIAMREAIFDRMRQLFHNNVPPSDWRSSL